MILRNVISGLVCLAFGIYFWWIAGDVPSFTATDELGGRFFPRMISGMIMVASLGLMVTGFLGIEISGGQIGGKKATVAQPSSVDLEEIESAQILGLPIGTVRLVAFVVVMFIYINIMELIGYVPASLLSFSAMVWIAGEHRVFRVVLAAVLTTALLYFLFAVVFGMNVPEASLF